MFLFCNYSFTFFSTISAVDAVVDETEEVKVSTEENTVAVVCNASEQVSETSNKQGKCC